MGRATGLVADAGPAGAPLGLVLRCDMGALPLMEAQEASHRPVRENFASRHENPCAMRLRSRPGSHGPGPGAGRPC